MSEVSGTLANSFYQRISSYSLFSDVSDAFESLKTFIYGLDPSHLSSVAFVFTLVFSLIISYTALCELVIILAKQDRLYKQIVLFECSVKRFIKELSREQEELIDESLRYHEDKIDDLQEKLNETTETLKVVTYILFKIDEERTEREKNQKQTGKVIVDRCKCDACIEGLEEGCVQEKESIWRAIETHSSSSEDIENESSDESEEERPSKKAKKVVKKATKTAKKTTKKSSPKSK